MICRVKEGDEGTGLWGKKKHLKKGCASSIELPPYLISYGTRVGTSRSACHTLQNQQELHVPHLQALVSIHLMVLAKQICFEPTSSCFVAITTSSGDDFTMDKG